jgi:hypothetical protein
MSQAFICFSNYSQLMDDSCCKALSLIFLINFICSSSNVKKQQAQAENIEWLIDAYGRMAWLLPHPLPLASVYSTAATHRNTDGGGGGARSQTYGRKKAWSSINHSTIFGRNSSEVPGNNKKTVAKCACISYWCTIIYLYNEYCMRCLTRV